ncbi:hypothetical protein Tco_0348711 [Tanacetum coccineum]
MSLSSSSTDFASWQQRIRLYCRGKGNRVNILKSIDEGPFQMGTFRETLAEGNEGALHLGPERPRVYSDLSPEDKDRYNVDIRATNILLQGLPKDIYTLINHYADAKYIWDNVKMLLMQLNSKFVNNMLPEWGRFITAVKLNRGLRDSNYDQLYAYLKQHEAHANENKIMLKRFIQPNVDPLALMSNVSHQQGTGAAGYRGAQNRVGNGTGATGGQDTAVDKDVDEQPVQDLALTMDNMFQADDRDTFDSDVDEAPTAQTMFMANLSSANPDVVCEHHEVHEMHDEVQPNYVVDSHDDYTSDSNMIPYDQYVKDNAVPVVQSNVSSVPTDAYMMILNDMHEQSAQCVSMTTQNNVVDKSLTAKLATYKEQVELYERRAKFELAEREQKIDEQLRIVITDHNIKEEKLKRELYSVKM